MSYVEAPLGGAAALDRALQDETWTGRAAYQAYIDGPAGRDLRCNLADFRGFPFDDRFHVSDAGR